MGQLNKSLLNGTTKQQFVKCDNQTAVRKIGQLNNKTTVCKWDN